MRSEQPVVKQTRMLSYARGPETPLLTDTIHQAFAKTAARVPQKTALIVRHQSVRLTFEHLAAEVERTARGLAGLGLRCDDRAGVWSTNCVEWVLLHLACARLGVVLVNVNPAYRAHELSYILRKSRMRALFLWEKDTRCSYRSILEEARVGQETELKHVVYCGTDDWASMVSNGADVPSGEISPDNVTNIQYTSGTSGSPKGVSGAGMLLPAPTFDALATLQAIHSERATAIYGVPTMFIAELGHPEFGRFDFTSLRTGVMAGAPCPIEVMKRVVHEMHCPQMTIMYGQTESSPVITMSSVDDSVDRRVSTVGCACPNTEVRIVSAGGDTAPIGEQGELCTRGYLVMKGYDDDPQATAKAVDPDGWLHTGDLATMRDDGYFRITGRSKDMIIRGGENIYPRELEEFLYTHPKIADVQIIGVPDAKLGETVAAWICLKSGEAATEDDIRDFCRGKIAHFKIPQYIRFVGQFPMTVTGKIQKFRMREVEIRERGLEDAAEIQTA